jgi:hypothetical protein
MEKTIQVIVMLSGSVLLFIGGMTAQLALFWPGAAERPSPLSDPDVIYGISMAVGGILLFLVAYRRKRSRGQ